MNEGMDQYRLQNLFERVKPPICPDCGTRMVAKKLINPIFLGKFDEEGNRQYLLTFRCPSRRWYHLSSHASCVQLVKGPI